VGILVIILFTKVNFVFLVILRHLGEKFLDGLLASLCPQNVQIELISLNLYNDLGDSSFEGQACHQLLIVLLSELLFT